MRFVLWCTPPKPPTPPLVSLRVSSPQINLLRATFAAERNCHARDDGAGYGGRGRLGGGTARISLRENATLRVRGLLECADVRIPLDCSAVRVVDLILLTFSNAMRAMEFTSAGAYGVNSGGGGGHDGACDSSGIQPGGAVPLDEDTNEDACSDSDMSPTGACSGNTEAAPSAPPAATSARVRRQHVMQESLRSEGAPRPVHHHTPPAAPHDTRTRAHTPRESSIILKRGFAGALDAFSELARAGSSALAAWSCAEPTSTRGGESAFNEPNALPRLLLCLELLESSCYQNTMVL